MAPFFWKLCCACSALVLLQLPPAPSSPQGEKEGVKGEPSKPGSGTLDQLPLPPNAVIVIPADAKQALESMRPGSVILSPEQYKALVDKVKALEEKLAQLEKKAPLRTDPVISQCLLTGQVTGDVLDLRAELTFKTSAQNQLVPVGFRSIRFTGAKLDGETPIWGADLDRLAILAGEARVYQLVLEMQVKVTRSGSDCRVLLDLPAAAITKLELGFGERIQNALLRGRPDPLPVEHTAGQASKLSVHLPVLTQLDLTWQTGGTAPTIPELAVTGDLRVTLDEKAVETEALLLIECRRGAISTVRFRLGEAKTPTVTVLEVAEANERPETPPRPSRVTWRTEPGQVLSVSFEPALTPAERPLGLRIQTRQAAPAKGVRVPLCQLALQAPLEKAAQRGTIAVSAASGVSVRLQDQELSPIEFRDLPPRAAPRDADTIAAYRYWRQPVRLDARIEVVQPVVEARISQQWQVSDTVVQVSSEFSFETARPGVEAVEFRWPRDLTLDRVSPAALVERADVDPDEGVLRVRLVRRQSGAFKLRIEGSQVTPAAVGAALPLPLPLRARRNADDKEGVPVALLRGEELRLTMTEDIEVRLAGGTHGLLGSNGRPVDQDVWLREPVAFFLAPADGKPAQVSLRWQPRRWPVQSHADVWLTRDAVRVRQTLTYSFGPAAPSRVLFRVPRDIDAVLTVREKGLSDRRRLVDEQTVERAFMLPRGLSGDFKLTLEYQKQSPLPPGDSALAIPLAAPADTPPIKSQARIWTTAGLRPRPVPRSEWVPVSGHGTDSPAVSPDLQLSRAGPEEAPLRLLCEPAPTSPATDLVAERILLEVLAADNRLLCRACFRFSTIRDNEIVLRWPTASESLRIERVVFHLLPQRGDPDFVRSSPAAFEPLTSLERGRDEKQTLRIQAGPLLVDRPALLEVRYQLATAEHRSALLTSVPAPELEERAAIGLVRWRVQLPPDHLPLAANGVAEQSWRWQGWLQSPQPRSLAEEMGDWVGAGATGFTPGEPGSSSTPAWTFSTVADLQPLQIVHAPRRMWLVACSLAVLATGLMFCAIRSRLLLVVTVAVLAVAALSLALSSLLTPVLYGAQPGVCVLAGVLAVLWLRRQRWRRQVVLLPGFTRVKIGSSIVRGAVAREPSTVDAPGGAGPPTSEART